MDSNETMKELALIQGATLPYCSRRKMGQDSKELKLRELGADQSLGTEQHLADESPWGLEWTQIGFGMMQE